MPFIEKNARKDVLGELDQAIDLSARGQYPVQSNCSFVLGLHRLVNNKVDEIHCSPSILECGGPGGTSARGPARNPL